MAKLSVYFLAIIVVLCQSLAVYSRLIDSSNEVLLHRVVRQDQPATTTTVAPPDFTACVNACNQRVTPQYNPVCGSNGQFYPNRQRLQCAQRCGLSITELHVGTCGPSAGGK